MKATLLRKAVAPFEYLFWRAQIGVLRACPPLTGIVTKFSMGAANSPKLWVKTLLLTAAHVPHACFLHLRDKSKKRVVLSRVSIPVTMRCTLNCDKCLAHIPDIKNQRDIPTACNQTAP